MTADSHKTRAELLDEVKRLRILVDKDHGRRLFDNAPLPYQSLNGEGYVLDVNRAWFDLLGYEREDVLGRWFGEFLTPESLDLFKGRFCVFLAEGEVHHADFTMIRRDGTRVEVSVEGRIGYDEEGNFLQTHCIFHDITEKRRVAEVLAASEQRFRGLFESSIDGILYTDDFGTILNVNSVFCRMTGFSSEELLGKHVFDITAEEYREREKSVLRSEIKSQGYSSEFEKAFYHADGHHVPVAVSIWLNRDENGNSAGAWSMVRDLSRERAAEQVAAKSEERYRLIAENTEDVVWAVDNDLKYTFVSPSVQRLRGYSPEELMGSGLLNAMTPKSREVIGAAYDAIIQSESSGSLNKAHRAEMELQCKDGATVWAETLVKAMRNDEGERIGFIGATRDISERKRAEEVLAESERNYRNIFEYSVEGLYQSTPEGRYLGVNPAMARLMGYDSPQEVVDSITDISKQFYCFPDDRLPLVETLERDGEIHDYEVRIKRRDGTIVWVTENARLIRDKQGNPLIYEGSIVDITERKQTEADLRRSEKLLNEVQRISLTGGWEVDVDTGRAHWTDGQYQLFGLTPHDPPMDYKTFFKDHVHPEDRHQFLRDWSRLIKEQRTGGIEFRATRADGSKGIFESVAIPEMDESGVVTRVYGSTRDITQEREAAQELVSSHERLLSILDGIDADVYVSDIVDHDILYINDHMRNNFGDPHSGVKCHQIFRKESAQCVFCPKPDLLDEKGRPVPTIIRERFNPLTGKWYLNHDRAIRWLEGRLVHMHMAADVTELKEMEQELVNAMAQVESASLAKNEFLANMSHEIRTPLNGLLGMLQLLQLTSLVDEQRDFLDTAMDSGRSLLQILNDILDLSKIESGKLELEDERIELGEVLDSVVTVFRHQAKSRGLDMSWIIDKNLPRSFMADKGRLRQILFNLIGNAAKFTESGRVTVEAYPLASRFKDGRTRIFFSVTDTGIGIPEDKIDRIFDPFTQVDGSSTRKYQGTGLGLGIVRRLVKLMGGAITVSSEDGQGTTMAFTIAATQIALTQDLGTKKKSVEEGISLSILVAEDERVNQAVVKQLLGKLGHSVVCVGNGAMALDVLGESSFDCILMDIQMPVLDGVETSRAIRNELGLDVPIVALTAHAMKGDRKRFMEAGMDGYVSKPFDMDALEAELRRVVRKLEKHPA